ncbi:arsenite methyltransferase [Galdieria sulphuraria]|uniref:Arsenite methyltransferase n=1 Tax=Galdieria sulphuraria TaxID=130081 RepID=M2XIU8_GALSU|nr:arsenite methyltransferase [Galdieria sulphuraria]EME30027.1 arsenite methyltransferase [Galdieria sulphuraria]|eukprot:XP_005706547.1 arsenite methyltransferase [Galdieria sulphuraria]
MGDFLFQSIIVEMNNCQGKKCQKEQYDKQREQVAHYYGTVLSSNRDLKSSACCQAQEPSIHKAICSRLPDEILERFYGCGSPIPPALTNAIVLDLGCGTGRDVYVCSALVGVGGRVIGLDMLDSSLQVARKYQTTLSKQFFPDLESYSNVEFLCGYMEQLEEAGVERESCDLVISNCVINLVPNKEQVFRQVYYTLKVGGELYFSDIYTDRRMSEVAKTDPLLICECLGGALYLQDFKSIVESIGFLDPRMVTCKKVEHSLSNELESKIKNVTYYSCTFRMFRLNDGLLEHNREDYGEEAVYLGTITECPDVFELDMDYRFPKAVSVPVDHNTANILRYSRYGSHFCVSEKMEHRGPFIQKKGNCCYNLVDWHK